MDKCAYAFFSFNVANSSGLLILVRMQLCLSLGSGFHYFCATRTFSNSLETSVTAMALCYWPWGLTKEAPKTKIGRALQSQIDRK